jgi:hypothetical protein
MPTIVDSPSLRRFSKPSEATHGQCTPALLALAEADRSI